MEHWRTRREPREVLHTLQHDGELHTAGARRIGSALFKGAQQKVAGTWLGLLNGPCISPQTTAHTPFPRWPRGGWSAV